MIYLFWENVPILTILVIFGRIKRSSTIRKNNLNNISISKEPVNYTKNSNKNNESLDITTSNNHDEFENNSFENSSFEKISPINNVPSYKDIPDSSFYENPLSYAKTYEGILKIYKIRIYWICLWNKYRSK
jgi:hypothetical protein